MQASRGGTSRQNVVESTIGLMFFGVPHYGLRSTELEYVIKGQPNEALVEILRPESPYLDALHRNFLDISKLRAWKIWSYFETMVSNTAKVSKQLSLIIISTTHKL